MQKMVATPHIGPKTHQMFFGASWGIETAISTMSDENMHFSSLWETLIVFPLLLVLDTIISDNDEIT